MDEIVSYDDVIEDYNFSKENDYIGSLEDFINDEYEEVGD